MESDKELINKAKEGDQNAFGILVTRHINPVFNFVSRITGAGEDANDIVQDVFLKIWNNSKQYDENFTFKTWLYRIARNSAYDWLRKKKSLPFSRFDLEDGGNTIVDTLEDNTSSIEQEFINKESAAYMEKFINDLPPHYKEIITLHYGEDLSFGEIALLLNRSENTVRSQHRRALIILKEKCTKNQSEIV